MPIAKDSLSANAMGGTELKKYALERDIKPELLDKFQIYVSRVHLDVTPFDPDKYRILWIQDLAEDPESIHLSRDPQNPNNLQNGWQKFHRIVFVSNWQMNEFINRHNIPFSKCVVMLNGVDPITPTPVGDDKIRIIYHTTPHRGLNILLTVFNKLAEEFPNIHLDLFSSFQIYGWGERDKEFAALFEFADQHPQITNHGSMPNEIVRDYVAKADIFAYPSTWKETSCMALQESMSAGLSCVHPNLGALFETGANWTMMYQFDEDQNRHATIFYHMLRNAILTRKDEAMQARCKSQKAYSDVFYSWPNRVKQWEALLSSIVDSKEPTGIPERAFVYQIGP